MSNVFLSVVVVLCVVVSGCMGACNGCDSWNTGTHSETGVVIESGYSGAFWKTYEGQLSRGFTKNGTGTVSTGDVSFCVDDQSLIQQIETARELGKPVKLTIDQRMQTKPWHCGSNDIVRRVELIEAK